MPAGARAPCSPDRRSPSKAPRAIPRRKVRALTCVGTGEERHDTRHFRRFGRSLEGQGTGDMLQLTSGPRQGESYAVVSEGFLRRIEDGKPGRLRCVRSGR